MYRFLCHVNCELWYKYAVLTSRDWSKAASRTEILF